jgi:hypothetical protein
MSSLVDYGSSDESENESVNDDSKPVLESDLPVLEEIEKNEYNQPASEGEKYSKLGLFSSLPPPRTTKPDFILNTDDDGLIVNSRKHLQNKQPVKIIIPSLSEVNGISINAYLFSSHLYKHKVCFVFFQV